MLLGSLTEPKECTEYVVFENHIARLDSVWRLNDKIYPEWIKPKDGITRPTLIEMLPAEERPEKTIPLKASSADRIKREEEKKKKEAEE